MFDQHGRHVAPVADWSMTVDDPARQMELRMVLSSAIAELPADYRVVELLCDVDGLSHQEIAETLGLSVANVRKRVHRAALPEKASGSASFERRHREYAERRVTGRRPTWCH